MEISNSKRQIYLLAWIGDLLNLNLIDFHFFIKNVIESTFEVPSQFFELSNEDKLTRLKMVFNPEETNFKELHLNHSFKKEMFAHPEFHNISFISNFLEGNENIKTLTFDAEMFVNYDVKFNEQISAFFNVLTTMKSLKKIDFHSFSFRVQDPNLTQYIMEFLSKSTKITKIAFSSADWFEKSQFGPENEKYFAEGLRKCSHLKVLIYSNMKLGLMSDFIPLFSKALENLTSLETLYLNSNQLGICKFQDAENLSASISKMKSLKKCDISFNGLGAGNANASLFYKALMELNLEEFDVNDYDFASESNSNNFQLSCQIFEKQKNLKKISLSIFGLNNLKEACLQSLVKAMEGINFQKITYFGFTGTNIDALNSKLFELVEFLLQNLSNVEIVNFRSMNIGNCKPEKFKLIAQQLFKCKKITKLFFSANNMGHGNEQIMKMFADLTRELPLLSNLSLEFNQFGKGKKKNAQILCSIIEGNKNLRELNLRENELGDDIKLLKFIDMGKKNWPIIMKSLKTAKNLEKVNLVGNSFDKEEQRTKIQELLI